MYLYSSSFTRTLHTHTHTHTHCSSLCPSLVLTADGQRGEVEDVSAEARRLLLPRPSVPPQAFLQARGDLLQCDPPNMAAWHRHHYPEVSHDTPLPATNTRRDQNPHSVYTLQYSITTLFEPHTQRRRRWWSWSSEKDSSPSLSSLSERQRNTLSPAYMWKHSWKVHLCTTWDASD